MKEDEIVYSYTAGEIPGKYVENKNVNPKYKFFDDGFLRLQLEKNNRGGKIVSVIYNFTGNDKLEDICSELKKKCGTGGTIKDDRIEIQGDKRDIIEKYFLSKGFKIKRAGG